jgi:hypothetical protein
MKKTYITIGFASLLFVLAAMLVGCGTGTVVTFGPDGIEVMPPTTPILIPTK